MSAIGRYNSAARAYCCGLLWCVVLIAVLACARPQKLVPDPMHTAAWCDTTPMKPAGRAARVPDALPISRFGTLGGVVVQAETGDALQGAAVRLVSVAGDRGQSQPERGTDSRGGFTFDSVAPGRYQVHVRKIHEFQDSLTIQAIAGRLDTVRLRMRAYRCYGY
jgi:Carboxypeptidase regulatory-like domain